MASSQNNPNFLYYPPPPHHPSPTPVPPPDHQHTILIIISILLALLLFVLCLVFALLWFLKPKMKKSVQETNLNADEHMKAKGKVVPGQRGSKDVMLKMEDDVQMEEGIKMNDRSRNFGGVERGGSVFEP